ncbi:MAG: tetratricopeptide repeat protein [Bryobacterales bacterium]|nr:tetratricopeptide repeat protein [Bryobacterales bacterium]
MPLKTSSDPTKYSWIGESVPEVLTELLAADGIYILDREQRLKAYRSLSIRDSLNTTLATDLKVAMELDAEFAVFGEFQIREREPLASAPIVLNVRVMNIRKWRKAGEIRVDGVLGDLGVLENRLGFLLLRAIAPQVSVTEEEFLARHPAVRLDALESYVRGLTAENEEARHRFLTQAARLDDRFAPPIFQLGLFYWEKENHRQAAYWLQKLPSGSSQYREAQFMLGVCELQQGRYAEAESIFRSLLGVLPMPEIENNLAVALSRQNKSEALDHLVKLIGEDPEDADYRFNLGLQLWRAERYEDAAERFREVLEIDPEDTEATRMLGRSLQREASRPARNAVHNLDRIKPTLDDAQFTALNERASTQSW